MSPVIPAWMPESRHMDVNVQFGSAPESSAGVTGKLPSMALDTRIPAGMTTLELFRKNDRLKYSYKKSFLTLSLFIFNFELIHA